MSDRGLQNQGWKDSWDSMRYMSGELASTPIALCEVQGYAYAALVARSHIATESGDHELAESLRTRAAELRRHFRAVEGQEIAETSRRGAIPPGSASIRLRTGLRELGTTDRPSVTLT